MPIFTDVFCAYPAAGLAYLFLFMWEGTVGQSSNGELHREHPMLTYIRAKQILLVHIGSTRWVI